MSIDASLVHSRKKMNGMPAAAPASHSQAEPDIHMHWAVLHAELGATILHAQTLQLSLLSLLTQSYTRCFETVHSMTYVGFGRCMCATVHHSNRAHLDQPHLVVFVFSVRCG